MNVYLPIAEISVNIFLLVGLGAGVGMLSGIFGVGGGFLMTPLLFMIGIPPAVAVPTEANQIVASSVSGALGHWVRKNVDIKMGVILTIGGFIGSTFGVWLFALLKELGQVDVVVRLSYVVFLGAVGSLMFVESINTLRKTRRATATRGKLHKHTWLHGLPFKMKFKTSRLYISALLPMGLGVVIGIISAIMGVGGGFIMVPAMIYILGMPTAVVVGTSLFQIIFVTANVTILQSIATQSVDVMLAALLMIGGVIGAQLGVRVGAKLPGEQLRILLALMVLGTCLKVLLDLVLTPADVYSIDLGGH